jgi:hypothetical protein
LPIHFRLPSCKKLQTVDLSKTRVTAITKYAFYSCKELTDIILPEGLLEIGESAFYKCNLLAAVTLPQTLEKIGDGAFKE